MEPQQIRRIAPRLVVIAMLTALFGAAVAFAVSRAMTPLYVAEGRLQVRGIPNGPGPADVVPTYAALMTEPSILGKVAAQLRLSEKASTLSARVEVAPEKATQILDVSVTDRSPVLAAAIANTLMNQFVSQINSSTNTPEALELQARAAVLKNRLSTAQSARDQDIKADQDASALDEEIAESTAQLTLITGQLRAQGQQGTNQVAVASSAAPPTSPASPRTRLNTALGAFAGLLVGVSLCVLLASLDPGLRDEADVRSRLDLPTLGVIPSFGVRPRRGSLRSHRQELALAGEGYRRLRANLLCSTTERPIKSLVVTSAREGEGKTRTAANLAGVVAALDRRVLLIDADMRQPAQHHLFGVPADVGMSDLLRSAAAQPDTTALTGGSSASSVTARAGRRRSNPWRAVHQTRYPNLSILSPGPLPPDPGELLASKHVPTVLAELERRHDLVVIDTSAVGTFSDALILARHASATILVVEAGRTTVADVRQTIEVLRKVGAHVSSPQAPRRLRAQQRRCRRRRRHRGCPWPGDSRDPRSGAARMSPASRCVGIGHARAAATATSRIWMAAASTISTPLFRVDSL
jgi:capsular polysaccharide biosynthesis protein/Mrp family chromosome partitioning ATPase